MVPGRDLYSIRVRIGAIAVSTAIGVASGACAAQNPPAPVTPPVPAFLRGAAPPSPEPSRADYLAADSITLEWKPSCLFWLSSGACRTTRLCVTHDGDLRRGPVDSDVTFWTTRMAIGPSGFRSLITAVEEARFYSLPDNIARDSHYCPYFWTEESTATITLFLHQSTKQVIDYQGCKWAPVALRALEMTIDRAAGS
jgi:hypothetical protein